ncbi:MAG: DUF2341 domain-containing protein [bacterium]|nr:DUF2341 domain-containing protein [bacterium]
MFITIVTMLSFVAANLVVPFQRARASTNSWTLGSGIYNYDSDKIEIVTGTAQLKAGGGLAWLSGWTYRQPITINNAGVDIAANQVIEINEDTTGFSSVFTYAQADGSDIRFTKSNGGEEISYYIADYRPSTEATIYVEVPVVIAGYTTTTIYMYYGKTGVSTTSNISTTFNGNGWEGLGSTWDPYPVGYKTGVVFSGTEGDLATLDAGGDHLYGPLGYYYTTERAWVFKARPTATSGQTFKLGVLDYDETAWPINPPTTTCTFGNGCIDINLNNGPGGTITADTGSGEAWVDYGPYALSGDPDTDDYFHIYKIVGGAELGALKFYRDGDLLGTVDYDETNGSNFPIYSVYGLGFMIQGYGIVDALFSYVQNATNLTITMGAVAGAYATDNPTIYPNATVSYSVAQGFSAVTTGTVEFQVSPDGGTTWYWHNGSAWATTGETYGNSNTAAELNTQFALFNFTAGTNQRTFKWKAFLHSTGTGQSTLTSVTLTYIVDTADPNNPAVDSASGWDTSGKVNSLSQLATDHYNYATPYFEWTQPIDNGGPDTSGIAGYWLYFGTSNTADPTIAGTYQAGAANTNYTGSLTTAGTYYLRISTQDYAGETAAGTTIFTYHFDNVDPTSPVYVTATPPNYSRTNNFTFLWPTTGVNAATDTGGAGLRGYQYKVNSGAWSSIISSGSIELTNAATTGINIFYLRAVDDANNGNTPDLGNYDESPVQVNFFFNANAPSAPNTLDASPDSSATNLFTFTWDPPTTYSDSIERYYYSVNTYPIISSNWVAGNVETVGPDAFATQQGENIFYVIADDMAGAPDFTSCQSISGNPDVDGCAKVTFTANTSAPGAPTALQIFDISNRDTQEYAISLKWTAPTDKGAGFDGYTIYRSINGTSFTAIGSNNGSDAGISYADTGLESRLYYYYVKSKDNAGQLSAPTSPPLTITPTGRYTQPPNLTDGPSVDVKSFSATIAWETDRSSSSFIEYGTSASRLGEELGGDTVGLLNSVEKHSVTLRGLFPETTYYYQAVWVDSDGNQGRSGTMSFITSARPKISDVKISNITLSSATVSWQSTTISTSSIYFGKTTAYGGIVSDRSGSQTTRHSINLTDLTDSSTYHIQISGTDADGNVLLSDDYKFDTLTRPRILDNHVTKESVRDAVSSSMKMTWSTNVPTTSIVRYSAAKVGSLSKADAEYKTDHEVIISELVDQTTYTFQVEGVDRYGNSVISAVDTFDTPEDTRAPKISSLTVEIRASGTGQGQKAQMVVSWETDEVATSQVKFGVGISSDSYGGWSQEDGTLTKNHVVIVSDLKPSQLYHLRALSADRAGNQAMSADTTAITGKMQNSILDLIMNSLERSLSFLMRVPFFGSK